MPYTKRKGHRNFLRKKTSPEEGRPANLHCGEAKLPSGKFPRPRTKTQRGQKEVVIWAVFSSPGGNLAKGTAPSRGARPKKRLPGGKKKKECQKARGGRGRGRREGEKKKEIVGKRETTALWRARTLGVSKTEKGEARKNHNPKRN